MKNHPLAVALARRRTLGDPPPDARPPTGPGYQGPPKGSDTTLQACEAERARVQKELDAMGPKHAALFAGGAILGGLVTLLFSKKGRAS
jgi:hypothetical protein